MKFFITPVSRSDEGEHIHEALRNAKRAVAESSLADIRVMFSEQAEYFLTDESFVGWSVHVMEEIGERAYALAQAVFEVVRKSGFTVDLRDHDMQEYEASKA